MKAVCGTSRGNSGTSRRPSISHSDAAEVPLLLLTEDELLVISAKSFFYKAYLISLVEKSSLLTKGAF